MTDDSTSFAFSGLIGTFAQIAYVFLRKISIPMKCLHFSSLKQ